MSETTFQVYTAASKYASPWVFRDRIRMLLWAVTWSSLCSWTPKPLNSWRIMWLRVFGCKITGKPFVHQHARIQIPWNVILHDRACVGDRANLYSLGEIELAAGCTVAQEVYLCTGSHDFSAPNQPLITAKITIGVDAFIGARTFVLPGVKVGDGAVIGAGSVVTRNMAPWTISVGNPCRPLKTRRSSRCASELSGDISKDPTSTSS